MKDFMYNLILAVLKTFREDKYIEKEATIHKFKTDRYMEGEGVLIKVLDFYKDKDYIVSTITENVPEGYELEELRRAKLIDAQTFLAEAMYKHKTKKDDSKSVTFEIGILDEKELNIALSNKPEKKGKK